MRRLVIPLAAATLFASPLKAEDVIDLRPTAAHREQRLLLSAVAPVRILSTSKLLADGRDLYELRFPSSAAQSAFVDGWCGMFEPADREIAQRNLAPAREWQEGRLLVDGRAFRQIGPHLIVSLLAQGFSVEVDATVLRSLDRKSSHQGALLQTSQQAESI
ncbi:hypothetical protein SH661x_000387 [Planctomicrobium sp. SH661]|uniref:hypothetical protein n=1 Tax=Planctomicrobium sp. SH661 TaxID=3448124 RepID=UPI003F5C2CA0